MHKLILLLVALSFAACSRDEFNPSNPRITHDSENWGKGYLVPEIRYNQSKLFEFFYRKAY